MNQSETPKRITTRTLQKRRERGEKISMLTAYDFPTAKFLDEAGIDILLVGDTLAMVVGGHDTTLPATMDQMIYHSEMVGRAAERAMVVVDLPFPEGQLEIARSIAAGARVLKETKCHAVKLEGGAEQAPRIEAMVSAGIPVMAHVGLRPQNVHVEGGYRVQREQEKLIVDAKAAEDAGAFTVLIECVPESVAAAINDAISVPTIGIGAGRATTGQVLVTHDMIGMTAGYTPKFVRTYASVGETIRQAAESFRTSVEDGSFPGPDESFR
ncbi:3-methyl-2-oxobutanoate hydroxymethyltransferase [Roseiconus lacunae]|uniref:3-methyl-2-oxobutanoate hydroxymethyltransferase n=1 Tax=Roseiconus lacunae TaxID=2605694 RepID=A0ABT7PC18_9BACT|nr:3-methyl-2-oxobutanoate hydroxymethyltransferase [Roseiconus lacunae]MCD0463518.1 3-methyl-2-oxobutanoate hydroxymethyltransferase [Roseiconus lacunae]MDM4014032.1 3-methyl-2-oxobutanoate hydroxymethyltransferase [Roseiconus lacunae]WRQ53326.1 3-methyl-2-oxobutanoate hydroxymethyltransferase [Stieleria sp. HD01]